MKLYITLLFVIGACIVNAQSRTKVKSSSVEIGTNLSTQSKIYATQFSFPKEVYQISGVGDCITVLLRGFRGKSYQNKGKFLVYNTQKQTAVWEKKITYRSFTTKLNVGWVKQQDSSILLITPGFNTCYDMLTGVLKWTLTDYSFLGFTDSTSALFFARITSDTKAHNMKMVDLNDGQTVWSQKYLTRDYFRDIQKINDSILFITADGMRTFNMNTGEGWRYELVTGKETHTVIYPIGVGMMAGGNSNVISGIISNTLIENNQYCYLAGKESICKLNIKNGAPIWETPLPENITSRSQIVFSDNLVILMNIGIVNQADGFIKYGTPFIAAYDRYTGKQQYLIKIPLHQNTILDYNLNGESIDILYADRITKFHTKSGKEIVSVDHVDLETKLFRDFMSKDIFFKNSDSTLQNLYLSDSTKTYLITQDLKHVVLDENFRMIKQYTADQLYREYMEYNGYKLYGNNTQSIIVNPHNIIVAKIGLSAKSKRIGDCLYEHRKKKLMRVNLAELINAQK